jgi:NADPH:quinone reductase-like Zn-dependent oxidoreductase
MMKAIVITRFGGPEVLEIKEVPVPEAEPGQVVIKVKAFGLNHAEGHMRKGEWDEWNPITGLECVGIVSKCPGGEFPLGSKVAATMGGLGRSIPGSYAEYTCAPAANVMPIESALPWQELAALPETYATAWYCLFGVLGVQRGQSLLIRGATSSLGQAALHLAVSAGAVVTATSRRPSRMQQLKDMGAHAAEIEGPALMASHDSHPGLKFDAVLNLVGNSVLLESLGAVRRGGRLCQAGWLGGLAPIEGFNPMVQMASGVHFSLFHSKVLGTSEFPLSEVPLQSIVQQIEQGAWDAKPTHVFAFEDIQKGHEMMDSGEANGKLVVCL